MNKSTYLNVTWTVALIARRWFFILQNWDTHQRVKTEYWRKQIKEGDKMVNISLNLVFIFKVNAHGRVILRKNMIEIHLWMDQSYAIKTLIQQKSHRNNKKPTSLCARRWQWRTVGRVANEHYIPIGVEQFVVVFGAFFFSSFEFGVQHCI